MTRLRSLIKEVLSQPKKKDCGCGCNDCGGKAPILTEGKVKHLISEGLQYHIDKKIQLHESVYRIGSEKHFELIREARALWVRGIIDVSEDDQAILETHLGNFGMYEGESVPLDLPMVNEETVDYDFSKEELIRVIKQLKRGASTEVGMIKAFEKALGRELTDDEIRGFKLDPSKVGKASLGEDALGFSDKIIKSVIKPEEVSRLSKVLNSNNIPFKTEKLGKVTMFKFKSYDDVDKVEALISKNRIDIDEGFYSSPSDLEDSGLNVIPKDQIHANKLKDALENSGLYGEWNPREGYFFFPEEEDGYDYLEEKIQELMDDYNIQGYIEGVFEESVNEVDRYSGFNRNPEDPDSEPFNPTGAVAEFKEDLRALFSKFKGDLKNPKFIKGVAEIMVNWKSLLRSQLNEGNIDKIAGGIPYKVEGSKAIISMSLPDDVKERIIKRAKENGYSAQPNMSGGITINLKTSLEEKKKAKPKKKDPPIGKPKRGGSKAYYVYVRDPKTKKIKKVSFGSGGLRAKIRNPKARKAFAARHKCSQKTDRTKPSYWSCRLPRYAKQLGLGSNMNTFW